MPISRNEIEEMVSEVVEFTRTYALWRELMHRANAPVRSEHVDFLLTVTNSLLLSFCVESCLLFDRNIRTKSLLMLVHDLRSLDPAVAQQLESQIASEQQVLNKISDLRNNVYAHRNRGQQPQALFAAVGLTPRMMGRVVQLAQHVVVELAIVVGAGNRNGLAQKFHDHEEYVLRDAREVIRALMKRSP